MTLQAPLHRHNYDSANHYMYTRLYAYKHSIGAAYERVRLGKHDYHIHFNHQAVREYKLHVPLVSLVNGGCAPQVFAICSF